MRKLLLVAVCSAAAFNVMWAAAPFGRMMPMHYGPDGNRTIVVSKNNESPLEGPSYLTNVGFDLAVREAFHQINGFEQSVTGPFGPIVSPELAVTGPFGKTVRPELTVTGPFGRTVSPELAVTGPFGKTVKPELAVTGPFGHGTGS